MNLVTVWLWHVMITAQISEIAYTLVPSKNDQGARRERLCFKILG